MKRILQTIETSRLWRIAIVMIVSVAVAGYFFQTAMQHPGGVFYASYGDGIKNYYTPMWYVAHDSGATFSAMNYPFTETMVYSDNQPLLSYTLKCASAHMHITPSKVLAILNLLPIISLIFCCLLVYYLLRRSNLPYWYALFFAVIINFHAPQVARLLGAHYGLSYTCVVPLLWICIDGTLNRRFSILWGVAIAITLGVFTFMHLYYLPVGFFMAAAYGLVHLVQHHKQLKNLFPRYLILAVAAFIPFLVLKLWLHQYDHCTDRVTIPYGLDVYHASFYSLFFPEYLAHSESAYYNFEGTAYVGWFGLVALVVCLFKVGGYLWQRQFNKVLLPVAPSLFQVVPWVCLIFFFLANASLFLFLCKLLPSAFEGLWQFRSVGRMAWVFYYLFACWSVWLLHLVLRKLRMVGLYKIARLVLVVSCIWSAYETYFFLYPIKERLSISFKGKDAYDFLAKENNYADWVKTAGYKTTDFQAILPIPFFNMGSEKVGSIYSPSTVYEALKASLSTGLPITTAYTTRASNSQTNKVIQLLSSAYIRKSVLADYPSQTKPLLILYNKKKLEADDSAMLSYAKLIYTNAFVDLYYLQPSVLDSVYFHAIANVKQQIDSGKLMAPIIFEGFDGGKKIGVNNTGAFTATTDAAVINKWVLPNNLQENTLVLSCWAKALPRYSGVPQLTYELVNKNGTSQKTFNPAFSHDVYGDWVISQDTLNDVHGGDTLVFSAAGREIVLDNFQVRYKHQHAWAPYASDSIAGYYDGYPMPLSITNGH